MSHNRFQIHSNLASNPSMHIGNEFKYCLFLHLHGYNFAYNFTLINLHRVLVVLGIANAVPCTVGLYKLILSISSVTGNATELIRVCQSIRVKSPARNPYLRILLISLIVAPLRSSSKIFLVLRSIIHVLRYPQQNFPSYALIFSQFL